MRPSHLVGRWCWKTGNCDPDDSATVHSRNGQRYDRDSDDSDDGRGMHTRYAYSGTSTGLVDSTGEGDGVALADVVKNGNAVSSNKNIMGMKTRRSKLCASVHQICSVSSFDCLWHLLG